MGANMHLHIEIKINDTWEHFGAPYIPRDYELYGKMGGVRREDIKPIVPNKGLPSDITLITKIDYERDNTHHASWFNEDEILELERWFNKRAQETKSEFKWFPGASWYLHLEQMTGYMFGNGFNSNVKLGVTEVRFVFWFDN